MYYKFSRIKQLLESCWKIIEKIIGRKSFGREANQLEKGSKRRRESCVFFPRRGRVVCVRLFAQLAPRAVTTLICRASIVEDDSGRPDGFYDRGPSGFEQTDRENEFSPVRLRIFLRNVKNSSNEFSFVERIEFF